MVSTLLALALPVLALSGASAHAAVADPAADGRDAPVETRVVRRPIDYTAWTLAPGEVRLGLTRLDVGVLPFLEVGSHTGLDALGIYNGGVRIAPLHGGDVGVTLGADYAQMPLGAFSARHLRVDATASVQLDQLGLHGTVAWTRLRTGGSPDPSQISPVLAGVLGVDRDELSSLTEGQDLDLVGRIDTPRLELAADLALAEHHAVVLQASMALTQSKDLGEQLAYVGEVMPDSLGIARALDADFTASPEDSYVASIAWQGSWRNLQLRAGLGVSAAKYAWLLPSTELSWRFGGGRAVRELHPEAVADAAEADDAGTRTRPADEAYGRSERQRQRSAEAALDAALRDAGADVVATE